jgi:hypothetical protein
VASLQPVPSIPHLVVQYSGILTKMSGDAAYASPPIAYATVQQHVADLAHAQATIRLNGAASRDAKLALVRSDMRQLKAFVQSLADADIANGKVLIEGAGLTATLPGGYSKPNLRLAHGAVPGRVHAYAKAVGKRASYHWQMGLGAVPASWTDLPETIAASTTIDGLTPATIVSVRFRTLTRDGLSDWSMPACIIVH